MVSFKIDHTTFEDVALAARQTGDLLVIGDTFGIATDSIEAGEEGSFYVEGKYELPKDPAEAIDLGDDVYWDESVSQITKTALGNIEVGKCCREAPAGVPRVRVLLTPSVRSATGYIFARDEKTGDSGEFQQGAWRTRDLNRLLAGDEIASLGSNRLSIPAGQYRVNARAPAFIVDAHQAKLRDITNNVDLAIGSSAYADAGNGAQTDSIVKGEFVVTGPVDVELQHQCATTRSTNGFGVRTVFSIDVYAELELFRIGAP